MKTISVLVLALAASVQAQPLLGCAGTCIANAMVATGCLSSDTSCICSSEAFMPSIASFSAPGCSSTELSGALQYAQSLCSLATRSLPAFPKPAFGRPAAPMATVLDAPSPIPTVLDAYPPQPSIYSLPKFMSAW